MRNLYIWKSPRASFSRPPQRCCIKYSKIIYSEISAAAAVCFSSGLWEPRIFWIFNFPIPGANQKIYNSRKWKLVLRCVTTRSEKGENFNKNIYIIITFASGENGSKRKTFLSAVPSRIGCESTWQITPTLNFLVKTFHSNLVVSLENPHKFELLAASHCSPLLHEMKNVVRLCRRGRGQVLSDGQH